MKKRVLYILFCLTLVLAFSACDKNTETPVETNEESQQEAENPESAATPNEEETAVPTEPEEIEGKEVLSQDEAYRVTVPKGWETSEDKQEDMMTIELQGPTDDQYAGIMVIDKSTVETMDIAAYMDSYAEGARREMANASVSEKVEVDINGSQAYYMVINGRVEGVSYVNWVYAIDGVDSIYVATASAYPANSVDAEIAFREIVYSFAPVEQQPTSDETGGADKANETDKADEGDKSNEAGKSE